MLSPCFPSGLASSTMGLLGEIAFMQLNGNTAVAMNIIEKATAAIVIYETDSRARTNPGTQLAVKGILN